MSQHFVNDSDEEINFKGNNSYAKNYNTWRQKEVLNKLITTHGQEVDNSESSSSDDDDEQVEHVKDFEKDFFKTLSSLKNKDPSIYNNEVKFFNEQPIDLHAKGGKKEKAMFLKDYERMLLLEKGGHWSGSEDEETPRARSPKYVEDKQLKNNMKETLGNESDDGVFTLTPKIPKKIKAVPEKKEGDSKQWLLGQVNELQDKETSVELKPLKDYWTDPKLEEGEKYLRNYILNQRYKEPDDDGYHPSYDDIVHDSDDGLSEDEAIIEKQEEFEYKYNYRFEEPDQDFIKRYPRTMENSLRSTNDRRKIKRSEVKERKAKEKQQKMEDLKQIQSLKRLEIEEKLKQLTEITGNEDMGFQHEDLDGDFDPDAYDKRMSTLFSDNYYEGPEEEQKPEFPDLDKELEIERWDKYKPGAEEESCPYCEDENFNMDCEYDGTQPQEQSTSKKRKRRSKFAKAISEPKPVFDPAAEKTYEEYLDEYYKLDCEDIIGNVPCRFKYRKVTPNSFGLSVEEILKADDKELNRWCSIKKAVQYRPEHVEKYDQIAYGKKGQNEMLKKKLLPSLYAEQASENNSKRKRIAGEDETDVSVSTKRKNKKKLVKNEPHMSSELGSPTVLENTTVKKLKVLEEDGTNVERGSNENAAFEKKETIGKKQRKKSKKKKKLNQISGDDTETNTLVESNSKSEEGLNRPGENKSPEVKENELHNVSKAETKFVENNSVSKKKKKKKSKPNTSIENGSNKTTENENVKSNKTKKFDQSAKSNAKLSLAGGVNKRRPKRKGNKVTETSSMGISDARLQAYGINPKKFKNKMKYGGNK